MALSFIQFIGLVVSFINELFSIPLFEVYLSTGNLFTFQLGDCFFSAMIMGALLYFFVPHRG